MPASAAAAHPARGCSGSGTRTVEEADVFAIHQEGGQTCIQVFFFRTGQNWGNYAQFPRADKSLGEAEVLEIGADARPAFPDNLPRLTRKGRVIHVNGLFRHGFLLSPALARMTAAMVTGETATPELAHEDHG